MKKISEAKLRQFFQEVRNDLSIVKELLNTAGRYENQRSEAYSRVENLVETFAGVFNRMVDGEVPSEIAQDEEVADDD